MPVSGRLSSILKIMAAALAVLLLLVLGLSVYLYRVSSTLQDLTDQSLINSSAQTSIVYAADGTEIAQWHGEEDRTVVPLQEIPKSLRDAVVAIEDERFYTHNGVDTQAIMRALMANAEEGVVAQGGSTITQQLVKLLFTGGERTLTRKVKEALLAYELEARTDKDEVLETYLNTVYFGQGAYGVEAAAQRYFGRSASALDAAQSATLAGIIRSPGRYSPIDAPEAAKERRDLVLTKMYDLGYLSRDDMGFAQRTPLTLAPPKEVPEIAPYFLEYVKREVAAQLGHEAVFKGGLRIYTTLEPAIQRNAEAAGKAILNAKGDPEYALVAIDHRTGHVLALVGGRDYSTSQFDLATQGRRQPGSAFKPFVLARALEEGIKPDQTFEASPYSVKVKDGVWSVRNYENQFTAGKMSLRAATNWSVNAVYARLIMAVGAEDVVSTAKRMGITSPLEPNPAIALGGLSKGVSPLEMASAYGTIANKGVRVQPTGIIKVMDDSGKVLYEPDQATEQALPEAVAVQEAMMLHDVVELGTATAARIPGVWAAGKTGTTQSYRDAWFIGYAEDISCSVWVGYREGQVDMTNVHGIKVTGGSFPAQIWKAFMQPSVAFRRAPLSITADPSVPTTGQASPTALVSICPDSMLRATKRCPDPVDIYLPPAQVPTQACNKH